VAAALAILPMHMPASALEIGFRLSFASGGYLRHKLEGEPVKRHVMFAMGVALLVVSALPVSVSAATTVNIGCGQSRMHNLIGAIRAANQRPVSETTTINLKAGCTYRFYRPQSTRADVGNSALSIARTVVINGNGATIRRMVGTPQFRLLFVKAGASLELNDVTLLNGHARSGKHGAPAVGPAWVGGAGTDGQHGGAIYNRGTLDLDGVSLTRNSAGNGGDGGASSSPHAAGGAGTDRDGHDAASATGGDGGDGGHGGAIYNTGTVTAIDTSFVQNVAGNGGAAGGATGGNGGEGADNLAVGTGGKGGNGGPAEAGSGGSGGDGGAVFNVGTFSGQGLAFGQNAAGDGGDSVAHGGGGGGGGYDFGVAGVGGSAGAQGGNGGRGGAFADLNGAFALDSSTIDESSGGHGGDAMATGGNGGSGGCGSTGGAGGSATAQSGAGGDPNFYQAAGPPAFSDVVITNTVGSSAGTELATAGLSGSNGAPCPGGGRR
jgi:hypothetical protein